MCIEVLKLLLKFICFITYYSSPGNLSINQTSPFFLTEKAFVPKFQNVPQPYATIKCSLDARIFDLNVS